MSNQSNADPFPGRLEEMLGALSDPAFAARLREVYAASARAVGQLSNLDLVKYETDRVDSSPDLSLWEEIAPAVSGMLVNIGALLETIQAQFASQGPSGPKAQPSSESSSDAFRAQNAESAIHLAVENLTKNIGRLGSKMRNPAVMSDRWNLLAEVQIFSSSCREQIGNLVFESAASFAEVRRRDVVPGYAEDLEAAILLRSSVADLTRLISARLEKTRATPPSEQSKNVEQLAREMDAFGHARAYRVMRAQDKRAFIELRQALGRLPAEVSGLAAEALGLVERLAHFVGSLNQVNAREILVSHDREIWAECGVKVEQSELIDATDLERAAATLREAVSVAQSLYGREPTLDAFLRRMRTARIELLTAKGLTATREELRTLLANVALL